MNTHSSGYYSIDEEYTIIGFNDTAKEIYPNLQKGIKCYKALMGLDSPCPPCPVKNKIYGPRTYLDPIRKIYETVESDKAEGTILEMSPEANKTAKKGDVINVCK